MRPRTGLEKIGDYFAVVDAVREVIGCEPDVVEEIAVKVDEVDLGRGFRVAWIGGRARLLESPLMGFTVFHVASRAIHLVLLSPSWA